MGNRDNLSIRFMARNSVFSPYRLLRQEIGFGTPIGAGDAIARSLYCGMKPIATWDSEQANVLPTGGVFNLEFSPEGSLLVAACEKKSIQIFDPITHQRIHSVNGAHSDCVNCVKFLDARMFATCSDDTTIALWDVRNLKKKIRSLQGHSNWVKNIEFSVKDKLLVTSGLDGSVYTWDINSYTEHNLVYQRVFHASCLMRCRLSPDARQMVMCTTGGLLIIIHDLNLSKLAQDLHGFKPNLYRLMQMSQQLIPAAAVYDHLFDTSRRENRVEFVSDFPDGNDAKIVSALQIHPQGWCALSRNISHDDKSEWSCIHDIQPAAEGQAAKDSPPRPARRPRPRRQHRPYRRPGSSSSTQEEGASAEATPGPSGAPEPPAPVEPRAAGSSIQNDLWEASITIKQHRVLQEMYSRGQVGRNFNMQRIMGVSTGIAPPARAPPAPFRTTREHGASPSTSGFAPRAVRLSEETTECGNYIQQNRDRLLYYTEETNEGQGFIKELCFSADGRLVCSPFGRGMRLLALSEHCSELPHAAPPAPAALLELGHSLGIHQDLVVSSKFSPRHHLLVTGCLEGKIVVYEPFSGEALY